LYRDDSLFINKEGMGPAPRKADGFSDLGGDFSF
jgi:hypothetical protein